MAVELRGHGAQAGCRPSWLRLALWLVFVELCWGHPTPRYPPSSSHFSWAEDIWGPALGPSGRGAASPGHTCP